MMNNHDKEGYTPPHVAEEMLRDIETTIDAFHLNQDRTGQINKEMENLLYAERAAILQIINQLP